MKIIRNLKKRYSKMNNIKRIIYGLLAASVTIPIIGDIIYGTIATAEEYMFGSFLLNLSVAAFSLFNVIMVLYVLLYFIFKKIIPCIPEFIDEERGKKR